MKKLKLIVSSLLVVTSVLPLHSVRANAEWKQDSKGWWNTEGNSWSVGWRLMDGTWYYFGQDGYMKTGWIQDSNGKWYYLNSDGSMAQNVTIDGYTIGSDGSWIKGTQQSSTSENILSNVNQNATTINDVTGIKSIDITKIVFYDGRGGLNKPITVEDKQHIEEFMGYLNNCVITKTKISESTGWTHSAKFFVNDKVVMDITFVNPIIINGDYFNITKGELDTEIIDNFLKSIDSSYNIMAGL